MTLAVSCSGKEVPYLLCGLGGQKKEWVVRCGWGGRCVPMGAQGRTWLVIKWFHEAEPEAPEGQDCLPLPVLPKRKQQGFPWELRSQVPRFGLFIPCNRKEGLPS